RYAGDGAARFTHDVVGRQPFLPDAIERLLVLVLLQPVGQIKRLLRREIREYGAVHVADVFGHPGPARVVVHHDLQEVGVLAERRVVLLGAIERRERVGVPQVPADALVRRNLVRAAVQIAVRVAQPFVPEPLPGQHLRIVDEDAPEGDERAVERALAAALGGDPVLERAIALARAFRVDAVLLRSLEAVRAEAADRAGIPAAAVARAHRVL